MKRTRVETRTPPRNRRSSAALPIAKSFSQSRPISLDDGAVEEIDAPTRPCPPRDYYNISIPSIPHLYIFGELGRPEKRPLEGDFKVARNRRYNWPGEATRGDRASQVGANSFPLAFGVPIYICVRRPTSRLLAAPATVCVWLPRCRRAAASGRARRPFALKVNGRGDVSLSSFVGLFFLADASPICESREKERSCGIRVSLYPRESQRAVSDVAKRLAIVRGVNLRRATSELNALDCISESSLKSFENVRVLDGSSQASCKRNSDLLNFG